MVKKRQRFLIAVLRFHGDVLLTTPMLSQIQHNFPNAIIDFLVYKGTGSILESDNRVNNIIEVEQSSSSNFFKRIFKEIKILINLKKTSYDFGVFLTTQWRMAFMARCLRQAMTAGVDDKKRRKDFWIKSFTFIFPKAGDNHIVERNLEALKSLGLSITEKKKNLTLKIPHEASEVIKDYSIGNNYCLFHPVSRRETKLWKKDSFAELVDHYANKGLKVVLTSGPDKEEVEYLKQIEKLTKGNVINLGGKTSLIELAALIKGSRFFIGLDSVASHIAAAVGVTGVALFGPSNAVNWRPWSDKLSVISREEEEFCEKHGHMEGKYKRCLCYISVERVIKEINRLIS